ncbi:MAG: hypothetical protein ACQES5_12320 [Thermodesulfobacteriota bacterium]
MSDELKNQSSNPTESITVELPCGLVDRLRRHAREKETTVSGLMIEALSGFLQQENK